MIFELSLESLESLSEHVSDGGIGLKQEDGLASGTHNVMAVPEGMMTVS